MVEPVDYNGRLASVYATGRALRPSVLAEWMAAFSRHASPERPLAVLDLGSGTGRFTPALADAFGGPVYGVEPADAMRASALAQDPHPAVTYLTGAADAIPLPDASVDLVLLFLVWHHVPDPAAGAAEIRRVLRPGGRVLMRSTFGDRIPALPWHRYFARAAEIERGMFPAVARVEEVFAAAGLRRLAFDTVRVETVENFEQYAQRLRTRSISVFEHLTEQETEAGFAALDADVAAGRSPGHLAEDGDLLVLGLPG
jgi:ubiquinone/menaquinone biosynthesis C-methylase UbiE